jgi:uncharacterized protein YkwD
MKRLVPILLLSLLASVALAIEPSKEITAETVLAGMNDERAREGLPPLVMHDRLMQAAGDRMRDMEEGGWWNHQSPEGRSPFIWLSVRAYDYEYAGENLAAGFETASLLVQSWMESQGHRENILSDQYTECGIAIIDGSTVRPAGGKSIVVMFGRRHPETLRAVK